MTAWSASIILFSKHGGSLSKSIALGADGRPISNGDGCRMVEGTAERVIIHDLQYAAQLIGNLAPHQAIALGALPSDMPDQVNVVTAHRLRQINGTAVSTISRTQNYIRYEPRPGFLLGDYDQKGMPSDVKRRIDELGGYETALATVIPELARAGMIARLSTSAGLYRTDTNELFPHSGGKHIYVPISDVTDSARCLKVLHQRCWLAGLGWITLGEAGQALECSIVDRSVGQPERLVFEGAPALTPPLAQDWCAREPVIREGVVLDTRICCPDLTAVETARFQQLLAVEKQRLAPEAAKKRAGFIERHAEEITKRTNVSIAQARTIVEKQINGTLTPSVTLPFDDPELEGKTVADVLANHEHFVDATLADPIEGVEYGRGKAKIMRGDDGRLLVHSFAHGGTVYRLHYDFATAKTEIESRPNNEAAKAFVDFVLAGVLDVDEIERLREFVAARSEFGKRTLDRKLKDAQEQHRALRVKAERQRRAAERQDPRPQIPTPERDGEWLPVMDVLNDVLGASTALEPPMRNVEGIATAVRVRRFTLGHLLTAVGANQEEPKETRLPAPEQPLLTCLSEPELAEVIERHIEFIVETRDGERAVHLAAPFVKHYWQRDDNRLPTVGAIATMPVVLRDGAVLAGRGLDRQRGVVFRIPPELLALLPKPEECTLSAIAGAMRFLCDDWLVDVSTDYSGKCVLIALALTIIERLTLPERPAFFITAARRGGGKPQLYTWSPWPCWARARLPSPGRVRKRSAAKHSSPTSLQASR